MELIEEYEEKFKFGKIKLTKDGLDIDGKLITNVELNSIESEEFNGKVKVSCVLLCDSFELIP